MMQLTVNQDRFEIGSAEEIRDLLARSAGEPFREIWANAGNGAALCGLLNGRSGFLMHLPAPGEAGFTSRNPMYKGAERMIEYRLRNGQTDLFPASWALDESILVAAFEHFALHEDRAPFILWHNEQG